MTFSRTTSRSTAWERQSPSPFYISLVSSFSTSTSHSPGLSDVFRHHVGISILASFLTLRIRLDDFKSFRALRQISMPRLYIVCLFFLSWMFFAICACFFP